MIFRKARSRLALPLTVFVTAAAAALGTAAAAAPSPVFAAAAAHGTGSQTAAFFLRTDLRRGSAAGVPQSGDNEVASALWSDDDITLFPGESETLSVTYHAADLQGATPVISLQGYNVAAQDIVAPVTASVAFR